VEDIINNPSDNPTSPTYPVSGKHPGGAPTLYKPEYSDQVYKLCLLGATDAEIAEFFEVDERTINRWKVEHAEFCQSLRAGKVEADANVGHSLYQIATGYEHPEDVIMQYQGKPVIVPTIKHYAPDYKAISLWLRNRRPDRWREQQDINVTHTIAQLAPKTIAEIKAAVLLTEQAEAAQQAAIACVDAEYEELPTIAADSGDA